MLPYPQALVAVMLDWYSNKYFDIVSTSNEMDGIIVILQNKCYDI